MGENLDDIKGRAKEAAGDISGDKDLKREGKLDQVKSDAKETVDKVGDKVKDVINRD